MEPRTENLGAARIPTCAIHVVLYSLITPVLSNALKNESPKRVRITAIPLIECINCASSCAYFMYTTSSRAVLSVIYKREKAVTVIDMVIALESNKAY